MTMFFRSPLHFSKSHFTCSPCYFWLEIIGYVTKSTSVAIYSQVFFSVLWHLLILYDAIDFAIIFSRQYILLLLIKMCTLSSLIASVTLGIEPTKIFHFFVIDGRFYSVVIVINVLWSWAVFHNNKTDKNIQIFGCFNFLWNAPDDFTLYEN